MLCVYGCLASNIDHRNADAPHEQQHHDSYHDKAPGCDQEL